MFTKINRKMLKFDAFKDAEKIIFNHYLIRKENLSRLRCEYEKGQFALSVSTVSCDFDISRSKAHRMIKEFENLGIIRCVLRGDVNNKCSIYEYVADDKSGEIGNKTSSDIVDKTGKSSILNGCSYEHKTNDEIGNKTKYEMSKKDIIKKDNIYINIIGYLNSKTGKSFKHNTPKTKSCIDARLNEGFCEDEFYRVIDTKTKQWLYSDMSRFLRPTTLFSNKFEGYLNEEVVKDVKSIDDENSVDVMDIEFDYMS